MLFVGTGRHRRRTQTEKAIAVAGVAGVGLAMPLLTATGASAAPASAWDAVAQCESGGNWGINTGNGFYGGLQFTSSTWKAFGGTAYASQANQASKAAQITVAEKVLASQGPGAWPVCSKKAGLSKGGAPAAVDTSTDAAPAAPKPQAQPSQQAPKAQQAPQAQVEQQAPKAAPKHAAPKPVAPKSEAPQAQRTPQYTPKHAKQAAPQVQQTQQAQQTEQTQQAPDGQGYTVRSGDTLAGIAATQGVQGGWQALYDGNRGTVGGDPDLIVPGQVLTLG
ncbi:transglycosylase family protein [Kitasatospora purpeofusca]|uniref:transglycosylase family protein n=1 Tax=Kitasatospora purpeofusca TaxID=67352 RepID=UPI002A5A26B3|nr:transglycosylase family protein [Kitasatospora purpeofusca]MDY0815517.1 transglycosylase family protein [Kitasatospora purpeofusca]